MNIQRKTMIWIVCVIMGLCMLTSLMGVVLGAINFVSPTTYPTWLLATWLVANILIGLVVIINLVAIFSILVEEHAEIIPFSVVGLVLMLVGIPTMLTERHFGWYSMSALVATIALIIVDFVLIAKHWSGSME